MKFQLAPEPKNGDLRIRTQFLLFPKEINREVRWLERASWQEKYCTGYIFLKWLELKWVDEEVDIP